MGIAISKLFAQLLFWLYELLDTLFEMFRVLCGIDHIEAGVEGERVTKSIIELFLETNAVTKAFMLVFLVSIAVVGFSVILSVLKSVINMKDGERKSHAKSIGQGLGAIITSLVMAGVMVLGISVSNTLLKSIYNGTIPDQDMTFSAQLFDLSVAKSYQFNWDKPIRTPVYMLNEYGEKIPLIDENNEPILDGEGSPTFAVEKDADGKDIYETTYDYIRDDKGNPILVGGWVGAYNATHIKFGETSVDMVFGVHGKTLGLFENADSPYTVAPMVELESFNLFLAYLVVVVMLVAIIWTMLGLGKRVYDLVILFIVLPLISATIPLDDGARFKNWRETVVSKVVLAYGAVFSVNVFLIIMPVIKTMEFATLGWDAFVVDVFRMFLMMAGALSINGGQLLVARLMGTSAEESRDMAQSARALLSGGVAAAGGVRGVKNAAIGGTNKYGRHMGGIVPTAAKFGAGAANVAGNILGGESYRRAVGNVSGKMNNASKSLRGLAHVKGFQKPSIATAASTETVASVAGMGGASAVEPSTATASSAMATPKSTRVMNPDVLAGGAKSATSGGATEAVVPTSGSASANSKFEPSKKSKVAKPPAPLPTGARGYKESAHARQFKKAESGAVKTQKETTVVLPTVPKPTPHKGLIDDIVKKDMGGSGTFKERAKPKKGEPKK